MKTTNTLLQKCLRNQNIHRFASPPKFSNNYTPLQLHNRFLSWGNPFSGLFSNKNKNNNHNFSPKSVKAVADADKLSERLSDSYLDILEIIQNEKKNDALDDASKAIYMEVCEIVLYNETPKQNNNNNENEKSFSASEKFDVVYLALCLPYSTMHNTLRKDLMTVLESILPYSLFQLFMNIPELFILSEKKDENNDERILVLKRFVHALLGEIELFNNNNNNNNLQVEEVLSVYLEDFKTHFPAVVRHPSFEAVGTLENSQTLYLQARLFQLLSQLCAELDPQATGKIALQELRNVAERVLGKEKTELLLKHAPVDAEGHLKYSQLTMLLTRPPSAV